MTKEFHYPIRIIRVMVWGMLASSFVFLLFGLIVFLRNGPFLLQAVCFFLSLCLLYFFFELRVRLSPVRIDELAVWNSFKGIEKNHVRWSDLTRVINRPDWSVFLENNTKVWILYATSEGRKTKLAFDNNIEGYEELERLVAEQVGRRGIRIEG